MNSDKKTNSKPSEATEMESDLEERDERRRDDEQSEQQDLNQGMQTGTHDSKRSGIKWGSHHG